MVIFVKQVEGDFKEAKVFRNLNEARNYMPEIIYQKKPTTVPSWIGIDEDDEDATYILIQAL